MSSMNPGPPWILLMPCSRISNPTVRRNTNFATSGTVLLPSSRAAAPRHGPNIFAVASDFLGPEGNPGRVERPREHRRFDFKEWTRHWDVRPEKVERNVAHAGFQMSREHQRNVLGVQHSTGVGQGLLVVQLKPLD